MDHWQVGVSPFSLYGNGQGQPNNMNQAYPPPEMTRRNEHFPYGGPPSGLEQHHAPPPPMNVPPPQQSNASTPQHATPTQTPAQPPRQRKRPAPTAVPPPATTAPAAPSTPAQAQAHVAGTPASANAAPTAPGQAPTDEAQPTPAAGPPPAKKSRTNTPWTPQEELRLKQMRDAGNSWAEIAKTFPTRTEGSVKKHWYKDMHYAEFAEDESQALMNAIKEYENNKWKVIGQKVGKPAKACEQYAKEHFPDLFGASKGR
jgi:gas vesicle protein